MSNETESPHPVGSSAWLDAENDFVAYMTHWRNRLTEEELNGDSISQASCRASYCAAKDLLGKLRYYRSKASNAEVRHGGSAARNKPAAQSAVACTEWLARKLEEPTDNENLGRP